MTDKVGLSSATSFVDSLLSSSSSQHAALHASRLRSRFRRVCECRGQLQLPPGRACQCPAYVLVGRESSLSQVFHEGLKSWSCCSDTNKPVLEFDAFMALPACTKGQHTTTPPPKPTSTAGSSSSAAAAGPAPTVTVDQNGVETYGVAPKPPSAAPSAASAAIAPSAPAPKVEHEEDDPSASVPAGARCKRLACGGTWEGTDGQRGEGQKDECRYHPQAVSHSPRSCLARP